ncbi:PREDICTED: uncharacterized protein LOC18594354 isoform X2 [Theobroma cacao]|uniref:Uncharacterized protein LOC18594354 isoform X2 n=1 Tax=Theobroma cacao TaxID=3641 RepID=A0AB32WLB4_THECC|nr:PREDICTED: uncharacterized protein LOC18594354 isoform X2 [Theobroma cacao]
MATNGLSTSAPLVFIRKNYVFWSMKIQSYLRAFNLWEVVKTETKPVQRHADPTLAQIRQFEEDKAKRLHLDQQVIKDFDLYGEKEPWEIWELYGGDNLRSGEDVYFFTRLKKKTQNSSKMNRLIGTGTWMITGPVEAITYSQLSAQPLGFKKRLIKFVVNSKGLSSILDYNFFPSTAC